MVSSRRHVRRLCVSPLSCFAQAACLLTVVSWAVSDALVVNAPPHCGGRRVVTHASAFFGPRPASSGVLAAPLYAPFPARHKSVEAVSRSSLLEHSSSDDLNHMDGASAHSQVLQREVPPDPSIFQHSFAKGGLSVFVGLIWSRQQRGTALQQKNRGPSYSEYLKHMHVISRDVSGKSKTSADENDALALADACDASLQGNALTQVKGKVAFVSRGRCDFAEKVLRMQRAGAVGVVVVNLRGEGERLANMKLNESKVMPEPIHIPAVMISFKEWAVFGSCRNDNVNISFTAEGEATFDIDYGRGALNWAMMRGMALWILCQCGVNVVRYKRRASELRARADAIAALPIETYSRAQTTKTALSNSYSNVPPPGVVASTSTIPVVEDTSHHVQDDGDGCDGCDEETSENAERFALVSQAQQPLELDQLDQTDDALARNEEDEPVCAVCLEGFEEGQRVRRLECNHMYHAPCLDPWLQQSSNCCPICKREVANLPPPPAMLHYGSMSV